MTTNEAIKHFGGITRLAKKLGIKPPSIYDWGEFPPVPRQFQIQVISKGKLKAEKQAA